MNIDQLVSRRTDLSTFLVHLTKIDDQRTPKKTLKLILKERMLKAKSPFGVAVSELNKRKLSTDSQNTVCFTETPLEYVYLMAETLEEKRDCVFAHYGVAITKKQGRSQRVNPVWYVDITPGHDWLTNPINKLIAQAIESTGFESSEIARLTPFIETMGTNPVPNGHTKEFWWEREWRHVGDFFFQGKSSSYAQKATSLNCKNSRMRNHENKLPRGKPKNHRHKGSVLSIRGGGLRRSLGV